MAMTLSELIRRFRQSPPATDLEITATERALKVALPKDYKHLMRLSNGIEGFVAPGRYLMIFPVTQLPEINAAAKVEEFARGFVIFGSDGSSRSFAFDTLDPLLPVVEVDDMDLSRKGATRRALDVTALIAWR